MTDWVGDVTYFFTDFYGLQKLRGQPASTNNYAFTDRNLDIIDKLLYQIFVHHHSNLTNLDNPMTYATPTLSFSLVDATTGGSIPAGLIMCYKVSFYDDTGETVASTEQTVDVVAPLDDPTMPVLSTATTGGSLTSGQYFYCISAVKGSCQTYASDPGALIVPTTTTTNKNTITFPAAQPTQTHWNIYRKKDAGDFYYLTQIAIGPATWDDTGAIAPDCDITLPVENNTNSTNQVTITLSGVPAGAIGYRIYRTIVPGYYPPYSHCCNVST